MGLIPGLGRAPEKNMATHSSILAWRFHGQRSLAGFSAWDCRLGHNWVTHTGTGTWNQLFWFQVLDDGQRSLAGFSPWGHKESTLTHTHTLRGTGTWNQLSIPSSGWWAEEPGRLQSMGSQRVNTTNTHTGTGTWNQLWIPSSGWTILDYMI